MIAAAAAWPQVGGHVTAVGNTVEDNRIAAATLTTSSAHDRVSTGVTVSQLLTDFGRTQHLANSAQCRAAAEDNNAAATRNQLLLQVDTAYFFALQANSVRKVVEETVQTRQLIVDQVRALAANKLKSELDVSFAEVNLGEAELLAATAENDAQAALAVLSNVLGFPDRQEFELADEPDPPPLEDAAEPLIEEAMDQRPELQRLRCDASAARHAAAAERGLRYPTISAQGTVGAIPAHSTQLDNDYYAVAGVMMTVPIFEGYRLSARASEAELRAQQAQESLRAEELNIARDVRIAWLNARNARERLDITARLLAHAERAFQLADARYQAGTSSIIELNQSQLNVTTAAIKHASAKYDYATRRAALTFQTGRSP